MRLKTIAMGTAAAALATAPVLAADAPLSRSADSSADESEIGGVSTIVLVLAAAAVIAGIIIIADDGDDDPVSA
ncbi:hypothetical protein [Qipengyuania sp. DGS5-3]|uniref:hypothetical protein n=1 Tax=Qipengyuania sp. DGS5-3 TaxID=3349632 RepID=UPI0036D4264D